MPLWSKLESGRIPQPGELLQIIENHIKMGFGGGGGVGGAGQERIGGYNHEEL
jgi:hypothetical protein